MRSGRGRQTAHLSKNSSAARSRSVLVARRGAGARFPLRPICASCLSGSMNRGSFDHLIDGALEPLPRVRVQFDSFLGRSRRSWRWLLLHWPILARRPGHRSTPQSGVNKSGNVLNGEGPGCYPTPPRLAITRAARDAIQWRSAPPRS
jgi:hypothetical protein